MVTWGVAFLLVVTTKGKDLPTFLPSKFFLLSAVQLGCLYCITTNKRTGIESFSTFVCTAPN